MEYSMSSTVTLRVPLQQYGYLEITGDTAEEVLIALKPRLPLKKHPGGRVAHELTAARPSLSMPAKKAKTTRNSVTALVRKLLFIRVLSFCLMWLICVFVLVAGIDRYPRKVVRAMSKAKIDKRCKIKPFVKAINFNHIMPTR